MTAQAGTRWADAPGPAPVRVVLATRNPGKVSELRRILADVRADGGARIDLVGLDAFDGLDDVVESGVTFAQNALLKAHAALAATGLPAIADDSGLAVDVLGGAPGIFSARWCGRHGDDRANLDLLLAQLHDVPAPHRQAHFACAAAFAGPDGTELVRHGRLRGRLTAEPRGANGFGYDPVLVPDGDTRTCAELEPAEKDAISHRGLAFRALAADLPRLLTRP